MFSLRLIWNELKILTIGRLYHYLMLIDSLKITVNEKEKKRSKISPRGVKSWNVHDVRLKHLPAIPVATMVWCISCVWTRRWRVDNSGLGFYFKFVKRLWCSNAHSRFGKKTHTSICRNETDVCKTPPRLKTKLSNHTPLRRAYATQDDASRYGVPRTIDGRRVVPGWRIQCWRRRTLLKSVRTV